MCAKKNEPVELSQIEVEILQFLFKHPSSGYDSFGIARQLRPVPNDAPPEESHKAFNDTEYGVETSLPRSWRKEPVCSHPAMRFITASWN